MCVAIGSVSSSQSNSTDITHENFNHLLNYAVSNQSAVIWYWASGMVLYIHSDASYISKQRSICQAGGHFFLSELYANRSETHQQTSTPPQHACTHYVQHFKPSGKFGDRCGNRCMLH